MSGHSKVSLLARHSIQNWEVADATARDALVVVAADLGKVAKLAAADAGSFYFVLESIGPSVWTALDTSGGGVTDHGALTGLGDDDHTQYHLTDGTRAMTGGLNMGPQR